MVEKKKNPPPNGYERAAIDLVPPPLATIGTFKIARAPDGRFVERMYPCAESQPLSKAVSSTSPYGPAVTSVFAGCTTLTSSTSKRTELRPGVPSRNGFGVTLPTLRS